MTETRPIITIDGPSGAGKSTISRLVAARLGYTYLDTGAMYRGVGLKVSRKGISLDDEEALQQLLDSLELVLRADGGETRVLLDGEDVSAAIRTAEMALVASRVSALPAVRKKLTVLQREQARGGGLVAEGRDMGTVVFPDAGFKFFLDATPEERATRRHKELLQKGQEVSCQEILRQIKQRDHDDSTRSLAPLKPALDAVLIDSSQMEVEEVVEFIAKHLSRT